MYRYMGIIHYSQLSKETKMNTRRPDPSSVPEMKITSLPVDETATLKVAHAASDLGGHVHKHHSIDLVLVPITQVVQQVSLTHEFCDDIKWRLSCAHTCHRG
jgi:hypothetical protein